MWETIFILAVLGCGCGGARSSPSTPAPEPEPAGDAPVEYDSSVATGQSYADAMSTICEILTTPAHPADPRQSTAISARIDRAVQNLQARTLFSRLAVAPPELKGELVRAGAARAGVCPCEGARHLFNRAGAGELPPCESLGQPPVPPTAVERVVSFEGAMRTFCDAALIDDIGTGFGSTDPAMQHAAYVDARVANNEFRLAINSWKGGDATALGQKITQSMVRAGLRSCPALAIELPE